VTAATLTTAMLVRLGEVSNRTFVLQQPVRVVRLVETERRG
jgi:hypothetical protein